MRCPCARWRTRSQASCAANDKAARRVRARQARTTARSAVSRSRVKSGHVEQRMCGAIRPDLCAKRARGFRLAGDPQGHIFVGSQVRRRQFGQSERVELASRHPARHRRPHAREHGQPGEQGVVRHGAGILGQRVEEEVGERVAREMIGRRDARREDEALAAHAAALRFHAQVGARPGAARGKPQDAPGDGREQPHPDVERLRSKLVQRVETAKDEAVRGETGSLARQRARRNFPARVAGTVAMRKRQQALGEQWLHFGGRGDAVGDYVVDEIGAHRPEIAEPRQRHRRGAQREDLASRVHRVSIEVDQQVDAVVADAPRGLVESLVAAVCEMIERGLDSGAQRGNLSAARSNRRMSRSASGRGAPRPPSAGRRSHECENPTIRIPGGALTRARAPRGVG